MFGAGRDKKDVTGTKRPRLVRTNKLTGAGGDNIQFIPGVRCLRVDRYRLVKAQIEFRLAGTAAVPGGILPAAIVTTDTVHPDEPN